MTDAASARRLFGGLPTMSVATLDASGAPHVVPLWFVWPEDAVYLSARRGNRTWRNAERDPRVALTVDLGRGWSELAGVTIQGRADLLPAEHPEMRKTMSQWHEKYRGLLGGQAFASFVEEVERLGFLRVHIERLTGWDHARG